MKKLGKALTLLLLLCGIAGGIGGCRNPEPLYSTSGFSAAGTPAAWDFYPVCRHYAQAVGLLTYTIVDEEGKEFHWENENVEITPTITVATAFAVGPHEFVTNAHVAIFFQGLQEGLAKEIAVAVCDAEFEELAAKEEVSAEEYLKKHSKEYASRLADAAARYRELRLRGPEIRLNHSGGKVLYVTELRSHPDYRDDTVDDAEQVIHGERDVALLTTGEATGCWFPVADRDKLEKLGAGMRVGSLGFPMEGLFADGGINLAAPEATFKDGCIGKVTGSDFICGSFEHNRTIIHNIPQTRGSSGSPIFLADGSVVAVFWGTSSISGESEEFTATNPVQQNIAVRIDALDAVRKVPAVPVEEWLQRAPQRSPEPAAD